MNIRHKLMLGVFFACWTGLVASAAPVPAWQAGQVDLDLDFDVSQVVYVPRGEYEQVFLEGCDRPVDQIGAPWLPALFVKVQLPAGAKVLSVKASGVPELIRSNINLYPAQPRQPKSQPRRPFSEADATLYQSTTAWPEEVAEVMGEHVLRGYSLVSVRLNPFQYFPAARDLYLFPRLHLTVFYEAPAEAPVVSSRNNALMDEVIRASVINPDSSFAPRSIQEAPRGAVDYLIITSTTLSNAFQQLADYRSASMSTRVLTVQSITSSYAGVDAPARIRNCISNHVATMGTLYVVLGGDNTIVPVRGCYAKVDTDIETAMPTDLYYSDLTGTWNSDGDGNYGELTDNVDMAWDVIVGRIPVRTVAHTTNYIAKLKDYEANPTPFNLRIFLGGMEAWDTYTTTNRPSDIIQPYDGHAAFRDAAHTSVSDSEMWDRRLYRDGIRPYWEASTIRIFCDTLSSWDSPAGSGSYLQNNTNLRSKFNEGWYHAFFSGHGDYTLWGLESGSFSSADATAMTGKTVVVYTDACLTGGFDGSSDPCLSEAFLRNGQGGALVYLGCSRYGWGEPDSPPASNTSDGGPSTVYGYKFYKRLHETTGRSLGLAFAMHKADMISLSGTYDCERWIQFGLNFQGDPALLPPSNADQPPSLAFTPSGNSKVVCISNLLSVVVTASENDGDALSLWATGVPSGATFDPNPKAGFSAVTNLFSWTPLVTGAYEVAFFAGDKDGTNTLVLSISVTGPVYNVAPVFTAPDATNILVTISNAVGFSVAASTFPDADEVCLWAEDVPAWAQFSGVTNNGMATNWFQGVPTTAGTNLVRFFAADKDGTNSRLVRIIARLPSESLDISGYRLKQYNSSVTYTLPPGTEIAKEGCVLLVRNMDQSAFEAHWGVTLSPSVAFINTAGSIPMINGDEYYELLNAAAATVDGPTPALVNPKNNSIRRNAAQDDATQAGSWTVAAMSTATPGIGCGGNGSGFVVISEYADASDYNAEFIELYYDATGGGGSTNHAPVISVAGGTNQAGVAGAELSFVVTASDVDNNDVSLRSLSLPAGAVFVGATGAAPVQSTFSWTPAEEGVFTALFVAEDAEATVAQGVRIVVGPAPLLAPVVLPASSVQADCFTANWQASSGATGYRLDVDTNGTFMAGGVANPAVNPGFETGDSTGWTTFEAEYSVVSESPRSGTYCAKCVATGTRDLSQNVAIPAASGSTAYEISYWYRVTAGDGTDVRIWSAWDNGGGFPTNLTPAIYNKSTSVWTRIVLTNTPATGATNFRFEVRSYSGATAYFDDFRFAEVGASVGPGTFVPGYQDLDVGNTTSLAVTGLAEGVWYYYRVRAYNASSNSAYSSVTNARTAPLPAIYTNWAAEEGLDPQGPEGGLDDDFDGDGFSNWDEFIADTQPTNPLAFFEVREIEPAGAGAQEIILQGVSGRVYDIEGAGDLLGSSPWSLLRSVTNHADGPISLIDSNSAPQWLYRVRVRMP